MAQIKVHHLTKDFIQDRRKPGALGYFKNLFHRETAKVTAVDDVSFEIEEGEFVGFVGPNGAGKTTTLKMLSGIIYPTFGEIEVLGHVPWQRNRDFQRQFSLIMGQKNQMWWDLPVMESFLFNKTIYQIPDHAFAVQKNLLVELLDIGHLLGTPVRKLSLGERMKCELATALLHKPRVLFLDEPTIGLDVISQQKIRDFLSHYNKSAKATIILTSHYMEDIRRLCRRVIIIDHGKLIYDASYQDLIEKYANVKTIDVTFREEVPVKRLQELGQITQRHNVTARLTVPRNQIAEVTTRILNEFPVDDISIQEESMEEIVRQIFSS